MHVAGSGRTDAGVHAIAQVAAVTLTNPIPADNFRRAVNRLLPHAIRISTVREAALDFHPRFRRAAKELRIPASTATKFARPLRRYVYHHPYPLRDDSACGRLRRCSKASTISALSRRRTPDSLGKSKVRTIFRSAITREGALLVYRVTGSGFLKHMVRNIAGVLLEVGKGNLTADDILARLSPECGIPPGPTAAAPVFFCVGGLR